MVVFSGIDGVFAELSSKGFQRDRSWKLLLVRRDDDARDFRDDDEARPRARFKLAVAAGVWRDMLRSCDSMAALIVEPAIAKESSASLLKRMTPRAGGTARTSERRICVRAALRRLVVGCNNGGRAEMDNR